MILKRVGGVGEAYETAGEEKLGEGAFGCVRLGTHRATGTARAIKTVRKGSKERCELVAKEVAIMKALDHPHIIQLFETFEDQECVCLAMELCRGGELFDHIVEQQRFSERQAAVVMQQILQSISYLRRCHVAHRDLKPENFMFLTEDPIEGNLLKLIDFGMATRCLPGASLKTKLGTACYMAPEVLLGSYDTKCDVWSAGVIMHVLLSGRAPFKGRTQKETFSQILGERVVVLAGAAWQAVSQDAKDLLKQLLEYGPEDRCWADQALKHDWIRHLAPNAADKPLDSGVMGRLRAFAAHNQLRRAALELAATQLDEGQILGLREAFVALDTNADGKLTMAELAEGLSKAGLDASGSDVRSILENMDGDRSGSVDYTEFLAATLDRRTALTDRVLSVAFSVLDRDGDGRLSPDELKMCITGPDVSKVACRQGVAQILAEVDIDGDGFVDFAEFVALVRGSSFREAPQSPGALAGA